MAENDIYDNKRIYDSFKTNLNEFLDKPKENDKRKYYCKYKENLNYFNKLFSKFETRDISYVRRNRLLSIFKVICFVIEKDLATATRDDIEEVVKYMPTVYISPKSKQDFIKKRICISLNFFTNQFHGIDLAKRAGPTINFL